MTIPILWIAFSAMTLLALWLKHAPIGIDLPPPLAPGAAIDSTPGRVGASRFGRSDVHDCSINEVRKMKPTIFRQGDVCLVAVNEIPADAKPFAAEGRKVILAHGEVTGHHHRFEFMDTTQNVRLYGGGGGARYLHVIETADLLHEEHSTVRVPPGKYLIPQQVEYTPAALRNVAD